MNADPHDLAAHERAAIDASCRVPVLLFFASAIVWLLVGSVFALLASIKLTNPLFFADYSWLTFGRIRPAHLNTVAYGWSSSAAIGVAIWLMARLCRAPLRHTRILLAAAALWNIGVAVGTVAILAGDGTSIEWLEFPSYAAFILFTAYAFVSVWALLMFRERRSGHVYVSQWYLFGALFWFPWLYGVANIMLVLWPVQGSVQAIINWWYGHNALGLWFTPIGIASAYYMIPKIIGKPVHSYYLSILGFWSLALFYSWNGGHHLLGGPIPAWVQSASVVASVMMLIPVITTAINHHMTMRGSFSLLRSSPALRFTVFGAMSYTLASLQGTSMAIRSLNQVTHFTHYTIGHSHLGMYAFFTMTMFGAMYYIVPRLVCWEWPSALLIKAHFWLAATGSVLMIGCLGVGGLLQGLELANPKVPFLNIVAHAAPWLHARSISGEILTAGHICFAISFVLILLRAGRRREGPTLLARPGPKRP